MGWISSNKTPKEAVPYTGTGKSGRTHHGKPKEGTMSHRRKDGSTDMVSTIKLFWGAGKKGKR